MNSSRPPADLTARRAAEALRWWIEAGVDIALDETPHDRFAESAALPAPKAVASAPAMVAASLGRERQLHPPTAPDRRRDGV